MKVVAAVSALLFVLCFSSVGFCQTGLTPYAYPANSSFSSSMLNGSASSILESVSHTRSQVKVGYQQMGMSFNIPIPSTLVAANQNLFNFDSMDVSLSDMGLWVGGVRFDVPLPARLSLFAEAFGNASKSANAKMDFGGDVINVASDSPFTSPWTWTASPINWWSLDAGVAYDWNEMLGIIVGYRIDNTSMQLKDPRNLYGPLSGRTILGAPLYDSERRSSDVQYEIWVPYFGFRGSGSNFNYYVIGSPFATVDVKMPITWFGRLALTGDDWSGSQYLISMGGGGFIEFAGSYNYRLQQTLSLDFWAKGSWFGVSGNGQLTSNADFDNNFSLFGQSGSAEVGDSKARRYLGALGVAATLQF